MIFVLLLLLMGLSLLLYYIIRAKNLAHCLLGVNFTGSCVIMGLLIYGKTAHIDFYIDIALIYGMLNFITSFAFLRYRKYKEFLRDIT